ncbi:hypothetical protein FHG87_013123 [Trinorchestia longiramus]|nr:hypothetical protein FHG87_013123 [Trinorchestia longiramus]
MFRVFNSVKKMKAKKRKHKKYKRSCSTPNVAENIEEVNHGLAHIVLFVRLLNPRLAHIVLFVRLVNHRLAHIVLFIRLVNHRLAHIVLFVRLVNHRLAHIVLFVRLVNHRLVHIVLFVRLVSPRLAHSSVQKSANFVQAQDSSSSQEVPRVSHRASSSSDLLDTVLLPEPSSRQLPVCVSASAPNTPTLHRTDFAGPLAGEASRKLTRSPLRTNCCFLSSSCHSCLTKETPNHSFRNYQSFPSINLPIVVETPLVLEEKVVSAVYKWKVPQSLHEEFGSVSTLRSTSSENSLSSTSLDFQKSDSNSKSIEETDIKCLVDHIIPADTIKELEHHCLEISCELQENLSELHLCDGDVKKSTKYSNLLSENLFNLSKAKTHRFPVTTLETEKFFDSKNEFTICDFSTEDLSQSSYEYSTSSSSSSVETLVFNPCIRARSESRSSVTIEAGSDFDSDRSTAASDLLSDSSENSDLNSTAEDDSEFDFLERECQSSDSDNETVVRGELEEIFRKFGFLSHFEDLHYRDFRSIGRCSTIHEETESDGSCGSLKHNIIVKTKSGMGQYYATAVAPVEETNESKEGELVQEGAKMDTPPGGNTSATDAGLVHEYDVVSFEDLKNEDIVDYKSEQFSKSPRSSPNSTVNSSWRTSQASTNTVESSSTAQDSDDTLGKDMSELSSINSRLSTLNDLTDPGFGSLDRHVVHRIKDQERSSNIEPLKAVMEGESVVATSVAENAVTITTANPSLSPTSRKKPVSTIQDALEDLEIIEKKAKDMLLKHESMDSNPRTDSVTPTNAARLERSDTPVVVDDTEYESSATSPSSEKHRSEILSPPIEVEAKVLDVGSEQLSATLQEIPTSFVQVDQVNNNLGSAERKIYASNVDDEQLEAIESVIVEIVGVDAKSSKPNPPPRKKHGAKKKKNKNQSSDSCPDDKPPLPPSASPVPKVEVKKRWWSRTKETPIFISRESYNEEQVEKELQRLRQSYKENDINDFLDSLENTNIPSDFDEELFEKLLADLKSDLEPQVTKSNESLNLITEAPQPSSTNASIENISDIKPKTRSRSSSASKKLEKVKERIKELLRRKKKRSAKTGDEKQLPSSTQTSVTDSRPETPSSRPVTPHSRSVTPEGRNSRPNTPDSNKSEDDKKGFSLVGFLKSSPKLLRKKYDGKKRRKSDTLLTSESEPEERDMVKVSSEQISLTKSDACESRSNLKGSRSSLDEGKGVKKEVRFSPEEKHVPKPFDEKPPECSVINSTPTIVDIQVKKQQIITVEETIDGDELQSQTSLNIKKENQIETAAATSTNEIVNEKSADIFLPVDNLSRAEHLLPKLPERVKPPRRKKKQKLVATGSENVATEPNEEERVSFCSDRSRDSLAAESTSTTETEDMTVVRNQSSEINFEELIKTDIPPQIPSRPSEYSWKEDPKPTDAVSSFKPAQEVKTVSIIDEKSPEPIRTSQLNGSAKHDRVIVVEAKHISVEVSTSTSARITESTSEDSMLVLDAEKVAHAPPIETEKSKDADSLQDDTISLNVSSDITETNSLKETSPAPFPAVSEIASSFYDNDNPFEEPMTRIVEETSNNEDSVTPTPRVTIPTPAQTTMSSPGKPATISVEPETDLLSAPNKGQAPHNDGDKTVKSKHAIYQEAAGVCEAMKQIVPQEDTIISSEPAEAKQNNSSKLDLEALTCLAETMTNLTSDMEMEIHEGEIDVGSPNSCVDRGASPSSKLVHDSSTPDLISRIQVNHTQHTSQTDYSDILKPIYTSDGKNCQTLRPSADKEHEGWVFLDKEFSSTITQAETISSKNFYGPSVAYSSYKVSSRSQPEIKSSDGWIQTSANPVPVPPRQFQQKMPVQVVAELKSFLSESETAPILRKAPEPLPRWDSGIKFNELAKNLPPVPPAPAVEPSRYDTTAGRLPSAPESLTTKPDMFCKASQSEVTYGETNSVMRNVSVTNENLTSGVSKPVVSNILKSQTHFGSNLSTQISPVFTTTMHEKLPTEFPNLLNSPATHMQDKDTNVSLPLTSCVDKSSGLDRTFKLRASVYGAFESSEGYDFEKQKPPVPQRRRGSSLSLQDGYLSDPGINKSRCGKDLLSKRHSMFAASNFGIYSESTSKYPGKETNSTVNLDKPPMRPPPPKSVAMIPTLLTLNETVTNKRPPPVPTRKCMPKLPIRSGVNRITRNEVYANLESAECFNRNPQPKNVDGIGGLELKSLKEGRKDTEDFPTILTEIKVDDNDKDVKISETAVKDDEKYITENDKNLVKVNENEKVVGAHTETVSEVSAENQGKADVTSSSVGGGGGDLQPVAAAGAVPKVSERGSSEDSQCLPSATCRSELVSSHPFIAILPSKNGVAQQCDSILQFAAKTASESEVSVLSSSQVVESKLNQAQFRDAIDTKDPTTAGVCCRKTGEVSKSGEGVFQKNLKRVSQLLDELDEMEVLPPQKLEDHFYESRMRTYSPLPPPRPRTPIDERDPEQVRAELRYEQYFKGPPKAVHKAEEEDTLPKITLQQINATKRYENYFLGPPRASTPLEPTLAEPDAEQLAAQKRYEGYFKKGPSRPRPVSEGDQPVIHPDKEQVEAEERYKSHFQSGPPKPPRPLTPELEMFGLPPEEREMAQKRYLRYFNKGPPRPKSQADIDFGLEEEKRKEAERRYMRYFEGTPRPRCSSLPGNERTPSPDEEQIAAEQRYKQYFKGPPRAKHDKNDPEPIREVTKEMLEAEERLNQYFLHPVPFGEPRKFIDPPLKPEELHRRKLLAEYWSALQERNRRRTLKVVKVSKAKKEVDREATPPTQRELVVEEFLQRVKNRKKEKNLHYGDTDSESEEGEQPNKKKPKEKDEVPADLKLEGGGTLAERVAKDLGDFIGEEALQQLGLNESSLLGEIESILGVGALSNAAPAVKPSISPPKGFTFTEHSKPSPSVSLLTSVKSQPTTTTIPTAKWMRTESGGYVKAPSQENLLDEPKSPNDASSFGKLHEESSSRSSKETRVTTFQATTSQTKTSSASFPAKFITKSTEFNQPNQFTAQYNNQAQQPPAQPRSSSLTRVGQDATENRSLSSQATEKRWQAKPTSSYLDGGQTDSLSQPRALGSHESVSGGGGVGNEGMSGFGGGGSSGEKGSGGGHLGFPISQTSESFSGNKGDRVEWLDLLPACEVIKFSCTVRV